MISQDGMKHPGSIIRIFNDGRVPSNNPGLVNKINWLPEIYQIGLRNPQGLELSPFNKKIYVTNHGAKEEIFLERYYMEEIMDGNY